MVVLVICKNGELPIKNEGARVFTTLETNLNARTMVVSTCKNEEDSIKNEGA